MIEVKFKFTSKIKNLTFLHSSNFFSGFKSLASNTKIKY